MAPVVLRAMLIAMIAVPAAAQCVFTLRNANVWTGSSFAQRDLAWSGTQIVAANPPGTPEAQAGWLWVAPPMVDAHTHTLDATLGEAHTASLAAGVYFALNPNSILASGSPPAPVGAGVDLELAGGGLTSPGGHPRPLYEGLVKAGRLGELSVTDLPGRAFHEVATPAQARSAVRTVAATGVRFVKLYLLDHDQPFSAGLDAASFEAAVADARRLKLRPLVHVETASDFRLAVAARVHAIVHSPGYFPAQDRPDAVYAITTADAAAAHEAGTIVVPTASPAFNALDAGALARAQRILAANLATLRDAAVPLAVGADIYGKTALDEANVLRATALFDGTQLLRMLTMNGLALVKPGRRLGLAPGDEAAFIAWYADPRRNWSILGQPILGVRDGMALTDSARLLPPNCKAAPQ